MFLSTTRRTPRRSLLGALVTGALTTGLVGLAGAPAAVASPLAATPVCTPSSTLPGISTGGPAFTDAGVAVFVGGDYAARPGAAESEGVLLAGGSIDIATGGLMNFGRAGGGSQIVPPGGSDMLVADGGVSVSNGRIDVGHGIAQGGNVAATGSISGAMELNGGVRKPDSSAPASSAKAASTLLRTASADLAALTATGSLGTTGGFASLTGDGTSAPQVFSLTAQELKKTNGTLVFANVGTSAPIVVNVSGSTVDFTMVHTAAESIGQRIDTFTALGTWAPRILWNFPDATSLTLSGNSQTVGSILAPEPSVKVVQSTSTNGRLWVGGDLTFGGNGGSGLEHHNYPWIGLTSLGCDPEPSTPLVVPPTSTTPPVDKDVPEEPAPRESTPPTDETTTPTEKASPPATTPPADSTATPSDRSSTPSPSAEDERGLASTGARTALVVLISVVLLGAGAGLVVLARRRATS
ncbi:choice-of-anchor A family protein [Oerskovia merdavium]|uniref:Choice-of-anchor A family protein n=1 Tax=Oerskovia merdavium TaxID=2762227 RepID=A0ABR8U3E5_9CELL|nr:choice-of-anchor A family protein [Oerskovia merdavium]MBD7982563.1 choice-of-anchor A family protein [Oerskovia merdavium]